MRNGKKVEQIFEGKVIEDYAEILSPNELKNIILSNFNNTEILDNKQIYGKRNNKAYCIFVKNVSYLGYPHAIYKKRIQIPSEFLNLYKENKTKNIETLLIGVYKYKSTLLFCDFDTTKYVNNKLHNSSAHVYTIDLFNGYKHGIFKKIDNRDNIITVFDKDNIENYLDIKFNNDSLGNEMFETFDDFFSSLHKKWYGIDCYKEMIENNFNNKFQSEWAGYYLEYKLEKYIKEKNKQNIVKYVQNKKKDQIDLDLYFSKLGLYGDLKAHSLGSTGITGNDYETIMNLVDNQSVYYIVGNHKTKKDKDHNYIVTEFWNKAQNKKNLRSYGNKMKHSVTLTSYYILEINKYNKKYLKIFKQGKNSNGKPREPKIMIQNKMISNFLIHAVEFNEENE